MRGDQRRQALAAGDGDQRVEDPARRTRIEIAGGFVGQQNLRLVGQGAGDGDTLLLAARQLRRPVRQPRPKPQRGQQPPRLRRRLGFGLAGDHLGQHHILQRVEFRQQVMGLIDEADGLAADAGAFGIRQFRGRHAFDMDFAAGRRFQQPRHVQQRGFARAAGAHQGDDLARVQRHVETAEDFQLSLAFLEAAGDVLQAQHFTHSAAPPPDRAGRRATMDRSWQGS